MLNKICIIILLSISTFYSQCQNIYFGIPKDKNITFKQNDLIIMNTPINVDGRFYDSKSLCSLINFIKENKNIYFVLKINVFMGSSEFSFAYSKHLKRSLNKHLKKRKLIKRCVIYALGDKNPLETRSEDIIPQENSYQSYIYIIIKNKLPYDDG